MRHDSPSITSLSALTGENLKGRADGLGDPLGCSDTSQQPLERKMTLRTVSRRKTFFLQLSKLQNQEDFFFFLMLKSCPFLRGRRNKSRRGMVVATVQAVFWVHLGWPLP